MHAAKRRFGALRRQLLALPLLTLLVAPASPALAGAQGLDLRAKILAGRLETELASLADQGADFAGLPVLARREHWYRPWQENGIVTVMDRALDNFDQLLLTQLVDLEGQLAAVNAHDGDDAPLQSGGLYLLEYADRPWFAAIVEGGAQTRPRLDGPAVDPDLDRAYGGEQPPCLRVSAPVVVDGELVAVLSQCFRFEPIAALLETALVANGERLPGELALFDGANNLLAGTNPGAPDEGRRGRAFELSAGAVQHWTLRSYSHADGGLMAGLGALHWPGFSIGRLPGLVLFGSATLLIGLLLLARRRGRAVSPAADASVVTLAKGGDRPERRPLQAPEKVYELLAAALGALSGSLHALAEGTDKLADGSLTVLAARGPGSPRGALRRVDGLREMLAGLERHVRTCRGEGDAPALQAELRRGVEIYGRLGAQVSGLIEPMLETERRLAGLPRRGLRGPGEVKNFRELTGNLHNLVGVISAVQGALGRVPRAVLRGEWTAGDAASGAEWNRSVDELHDLLLLLARQAGATAKLLELLPVATDPVIEVTDISAQVLAAGAAAGASASTPAAPTAPPTPGFDFEPEERAHPEPENASAPEPESAAEAAAAGGHSFELLGGGNRKGPNAKIERPRRLPSR